MTVEQSGAAVRPGDHGSEPWLRGLALPPIDRLPSRPGRDNELATFVKSRTRPWGGVPVDLSTGVAGGLWTLLMLNVALGTWLFAVRSGSAPCSGALCWSVTLGDHPLAALVLTSVCAGALVVAAPVTRGLRRAAGPQLALIVVGALSGCVALVGVVAVLAAALVALAVAFAIFAVVVERL